MDVLPVPEFIDPVFAKKSPKRSFLVIENDRFGLVFAETGSINPGTDRHRRKRLKAMQRKISNAKCQYLKK